MNKKLILITLMLLLTVTISLLTISYLWFNQSTNVVIHPVAIEAVPLNLAVNVEVASSQPSYMGQTGKTSGLDAPYTIDFDVTMSCNAKEQYNQNLRLNIRDMDIKMWNYIEPEGENPAQNYFHLTEEQIGDNFTWRIVYLDDIYLPDNEGYMYKTNGSRITYLAFSSGDEIHYTLRMIYLGEAKYRLWQQARYDEYEEFAFCASDFMDARFRFSIDFKLSSAEQNFNNQISYEVKDSTFDSNKTGSHVSTTHIFTYEPQIKPYSGGSGDDMAVRAYINGITIVKSNGEEVELTPEEIGENFTLRITYNNFKKKPNGNAAYLNYIYESYGQNNVWMIMTRNELADIKIEVVCQDEEDYCNMLPGLAGYPQTLFAYATGEYKNAVLHFDIRYDMVAVPSTSNLYIFDSITTMGRIDSAYDGKSGSSGNTYLFNNNIIWKPSVSDYVRLTITGVTILRTDGVTQTLTAAQITNNFTLNVIDSSYTWVHYGGALPSHKYFMARQTMGMWGDFLKLNANTEHSVNMVIAYSGGSSFAFSASQYINATFCFDVKIEVTDFY